MAEFISPVGFALGAMLTLIVVVLHYSRGTGWESRQDIAQEVLERRAETVSETDFAEPMNRSIGGGAPAAAIGGGEAGEGAELEGEATEEAAGPADIPDDEVEYFEVEFMKEGTTIEVPNNQPLLDSGEDEGMDLPYACRQGQCVSCAAHIPDGPGDEFVTHFKQETFSDEEIGDGYILTCVAYPKASFSIETSEAP